MATPIAVSDLPKRSSLATYRRRQVLAKQLMKIRIDAKLSREDAAKRAKVSFDTWKRWELGKTAIPIERVPDIRRALMTGGLVIADRISNAFAAQIAA